MKGSENFNGNNIGLVSLLKFENYESDSIFWNKQRGKKFIS